VKPEERVEFEKGFAELGKDEVEMDAYPFTLLSSTRRVLFT